MSSDRCASSAIALIASRSAADASLASAIDDHTPLTSASLTITLDDTLDASRKPTTPQHGDDLHARLVQAGADDVIARAAQRLYVGSDTTANRNGVA